MAMMYGPSTRYYYYALNVGRKVGVRKGRSMDGLQCTDFGLMPMWKWHASPASLVPRPECLPTCGSIVILLVVPVP